MNDIFDLLRSAKVYTDKARHKIFISLDDGLTVITPEGKIISTASLLNLHRQPMFEDVLRLSLKQIHKMTQESTK